MTDILELLTALLRLESMTDSLEIGTPARGGVLKVYGNYDDPDGFERKLNNAVELRKKAQARMSETETGA